MWRWARGYGIGASALYLVLVALLLLLVMGEAQANVSWLALILGLPAVGAALYLRGCANDSGHRARLQRAVGWPLMLLGLYGLISFSMFAGPLLLFCLPAAVMRGPDPAGTRPATGQSQPNPE